MMPTTNAMRVQARLYGTTRWVAAVAEQVDSEWLPLVIVERTTCAEAVEEARARAMREWPQDAEAIVSAPLVTWSSWGGRGLYR